MNKTSLPTFQDRVSDLLNDGYVEVDTLPSKTYQLPVTLNSLAEVKYFKENKKGGDWVIVIGEDPKAPVQAAVDFNRQLIKTSLPGGKEKISCTGNGVDCYMEIKKDECGDIVEVTIIVAPVA